MERVLKVKMMGTIAAALIAAVALLALLATPGPDTARANHAVTLGLDMKPLTTPANTATSLGSNETCLDVTRLPFNDDGDGATDEDALDGIDNDGDTQIDEDPAGQLFKFDVWITGIGHDTTPGLLAFDIPEETCILWNARRQRRVGPAVIRRQRRQLDETLRAVPEEGYDQVVVLGPADVEHGTVRIEG